MTRPIIRCMAAAAIVACSIAGCTNPLGSSPMDYSNAAAGDRLRSIDLLDIAAYKQPEPDEAVDAAERQARVVAASRARFEGLDRYEVRIEAVRLATLENNLGIKASLISPAIAAERVSEEEARFESVFTLSSRWGETDSPTASTLAGSQTKSQSITPGVRVPLRTGGTVEIRMPINRFETDNAFSTLNPAWTSDLELSLSHSLLRGAGRRATTHQIRIADINRQISESQTKLEVIRQIANADRAYWRLYASQQALEVRVEAYTVAVEQLESAQRKEAAGSGAQIDVVRARSEVASRVEAVIRSQNTLLRAQRQLKQVMNIPGLDVDSTTLVMPMTEPDPVEYLFDAGELTEAALANRMEMLELELRLAADAANIAFGRNQALPLLALSYTYRFNGLGSTLEDSLEITTENNFEDWDVSLRAEIPLGNEQRRSALAQSILTRLQRLATRDQRAQAITREVYDAIDSLSTNWQRILASRESVALSARTLAAEQRQFAVGRSNSINVLDANRALLETRLLEIQAIADYEIAQVDLAFASGTLLGSAKVDWAPSDPRDGAGWTDGAGELRYRPLDGIFGRD